MVRSKVCTHLYGILLTSAPHPFLPPPHTPTHPRTRTHTHTPTHARAHTHTHTHTHTVLLHNCIQEFYRFYYRLCHVKNVWLADLFSEIFQPIFIMEKWDFLIILLSKHLHHWLWMYINPLNAKLNPTCHSLALLGAHPILHISKVRVKPGVSSCIMSLAITHYKWKINWRDSHGVWFISILH